MSPQQYTTHFTGVKKSEWEGRKGDLQVLSLLQHLSHHSMPIGYMKKRGFMRCLPTCG